MQTLFIRAMSNNDIFKASALWADAFYKSKCPSVCLSVCLSVCVFTFEVSFKRLFAPTSMQNTVLSFTERRSHWAATSSDH